TVRKGDTLYAIAYCIGLSQ
ncbi:MAG: LysM peptidoglycan-binding domain-containing protein, partial [Armatimonadetes bacterium]|nr:LysM peptidoglycan-binding domain-containing protein [Armatimonadota bacterium]